MIRRIHDHRRSVVCRLCRSSRGMLERKHGFATKSQADAGKRLFSRWNLRRPLVEGTVARGDLELDSHLYRGFVDGRPALTFPSIIRRKQMGRSRRAAELALGASRTGRNNSRFIARCAMAMQATDTASSPNGDSSRRPRFTLTAFAKRQSDIFSTSSPTATVRCTAMAIAFSAADRWAIVAYIRTLQMSQATPARSTRLPRKYNESGGSQ